MTKKNWLPAAVAAFVLAGCGAQRPAGAPLAQNAPAPVAAAAKAPSKMMPMIHYITFNGMMGSSFTAPPNTRVQLQAYATGDGMLDYWWSGWGVMGMNAWATWITPSSPGMYTINLTVRDQKFQSTFQSIWVQVRPNAKVAKAHFTNAEKAEARIDPDAPALPAAPAER